MTGNRWLGVGAAGGFIVCAVSLLFDPKAALAGYLVAWFAIAAVPVGALGVLFVSWLVRGGWTQDLHAPLSRAARCIPFAGLLFIPVLAGMTVLYPWSAGVPLPSFKAIYLSLPFFLLRTIAYFAIWSALTMWAERSFADPDARVRAASVGLIVWPVTVSFAGIDWLESLTPDFHSSIYGLLVVTFALLAGLAFGLVVALRRLPRRMSNLAYGGVLLATLLLWAYLHAMQYIIIWAGNIPDEVTWYAERTERGWAITLWVLFVAQFIGPFFALLSERVRGSTQALIAIAAATLALRFLEAAVLVLPPLKLASPLLGFLTLASAALAVTTSLVLFDRLAASRLGRPVLTT